MMEWLTGTTAGKFIWAFLISMVPIVELRGGLPVAITSGLSWPLAYLATVLGNMLPVPFIIIFIKKIFAWLRLHWAAAVRRHSRAGHGRLDGRADRSTDEHAPEAGGTDHSGRRLYRGTDCNRSYLRGDSRLLTEVDDEVSVLDPGSGCGLSPRITELFDHILTP